MKLVSASEVLRSLNSGGGTMTLLQIDFPTCIDQVEFTESLIKPDGLRARVLR